MAYLALYRRWRPTSLDELKGQSHVRHAIKRAVQEGKIGHAYLFAGPRGTGKTSTAKILAKVLNCLNPKDGEPCGECESCKKIDSNASMDVFEIDAASNRGIDEIRDLRETVKFAPVDGKYKVYIIDEVHMLTPEAFNALLKTLEEPPGFVIFILATTEAHKVPATIQSRCQRFDFRRISIDEIKDRLKFVASEMNFEAEEDAVSLIATHADGGLRDALSLLDQCAAISGGNIKKSDVEDILGLVGNAWTSELAAAIGENDTKKVFSMIDEITKKGKELAQIINELSLCLRSIMIYEAADSLDDSLSLYHIDEKYLEKLKNLFSRERIISALKKLNETAYALKWTNAPRITVEVALLSLCSELCDNSNSVSSGVDDSRILRLESMVKELSLKIQNQMFVKTEAAPVKSTATTSNVIAPVNKETQPKIEKIEKPKTTVSTAANNRQVEPLTQSEPKDAAVLSKDGEKLWESILKHFEETGNRSVFACLKQGVCAGLSDSAIVISFKSEMLANITAVTYKKLVEDSIKKISGKSLTLITQMGKKAKTPAKTANIPQKSSAVSSVAKSAENIKTPPKIEINENVLKNSSGLKLDLSQLSEDESKNLKKAVGIFGDNFISSIDTEVKKIKIAESENKILPKKMQNIPITDEYDFVDEPDFSEIPPPDMDFV